MSEDAEFKGKIGRTYKDSTPWWPPENQAPEQAPDVLFIVLDDVGYSDLGCYGSEIATPNMDALAMRGLRYSNFHVTSMCSPTRACLLTGRNAHAVGMGIIAEWSSGYPGYRGRISRRAATVPEILRDHAYGTYAVGKWHLTNIADYGAAGPHDHWPIGRGFGRWYGFHGALADQWNPELYQDNHMVKFVSGSDYHLSTDLVDHAIANIRDHITSAPRTPFFQYLAFGACHWPHHVPGEYMARHRGRYDGGWDTIRAERLARQKEMGLVPHDTDLAPPNPDVKPWSELSDGERRLYARLQETYAAFLEHTDAEIGRLVDYLASIGRLDNTMIVLLSDNGASAEGGPTGAINLRKHMVYEKETPEVGLARIDEIGSARAFNHYPTGWAQVSNTPLKWYKKNTHGGGVRAPLILHWPEKLRDVAGAIRHQYHHVSDIAPTLYEILGIAAPSYYHGLEQIPVQGTSMAYTFDQADAPTRKRTQIFELLGDRAIWHEGWKAVAHHTKGDEFDSDRWELYHLDHDFSEVHDLAAVEPERLRQLIDLWWDEAKRFNVLPLDDRDWERAAVRLRMNPTTQYDYLAGMARIDRLSAPDITDRSYRIIATFRAEPETKGVLLAWGSRFAGFVLLINNNSIRYEYVYKEERHHVIEVPLPMVAGENMMITLAFRKTGRNAGTATLSANGEQLGTTEIGRTWPTHGTTAGLYCGEDLGAPVIDSYTRPFRFIGADLKVSVELETDGESDPSQPYKTVLAEQ